MEVAGMLEGIVRANWGCNLMRRVGYHTGRFLAAILAALPALGFISAVEAGEPASEYSCEELWRERNAIYAEQGYCFKNAKVIAAFGRGCFPPTESSSNGRRSALPRLSIGNSARAAVDHAQRMPLRKIISDSPRHCRARGAGAFRSAYDKV
jgi:YARHG domain